jgi:nucleotide-binding universal stress UspA family protein
MARSVSMTETAEKRERIVVGFDGSEGSRRALEWAAEEALRRVISLVVVRAWTPGEFGTDEEMGVIAQTKLDEEVAGILGEHPAVEVLTIAEQGHAARVLIRQAESADMLVVGSRGRGGFTGLVLGSVSHQVATHADASVVVIVKR